MAARKASPAYDPDKRYDVTLARVAEHEGFTLKPGPAPIAMSGALANAIAHAISEARELPPEPAQPEAPPCVHEAAEG